MISFLLFMSNLSLVVKIHFIARRLDALVDLAINCRGDNGNQIHLYCSTPSQNKNKKKKKRFAPYRPIYFLVFV